MPTIANLRGVPDQKDGARRHEALAAPDPAAPGPDDVLPARFRLRLGRRGFVALLAVVPLLLAAVLLLVAAFVAAGILSLAALAIAGVVLLGLRRRKG
jgi:hypothetical protein